MKTIVRTLIILLAAMIVVAVAVGFAQSSFAVALAPGMPAEERGAAPVLVTNVVDGTADTAGSSVTFDAGDSTAAADTDTNGAGTASATTATAPVFAGGGSRPGHDAAGGIQGALPLAKNFVIMALIVGMVAFMPQGFARLRQGRIRLHVR